MKYAWIKANEKEFPIHMMCASLNVVRSVYYKWRNTPQTAHDERDVTLMIWCKKNLKQVVVYTAKCVFVRHYKKKAFNV